MSGDDKPRFTAEDKERFEKWMNEWSHQLGSHWSVYTLVKAAFKHATLYEREAIINKAKEIEAATEPYKGHIIAGRK